MAGPNHMISRWMSAREAARHLKMSGTTFKQKVVNSGLLTGEKHNSKTYFRGEEVRLLAIKLDRENVSGGALAAEVFEAFEQGKTFAEVVMTYRIDPITVRELYYEWKTDLEAGFARTRTQKALKAQEQRAQQEREKLEEARKEEFHQAMLTKVEEGFLK